MTVSHLTIIIFALLYILEVNSNRKLKKMIKELLEECEG